MGVGLREAFKEFDVQRPDVFVSTKLWVTKMKPEKVEDALRNSLKALQLDYVDLYLMHYPTAMVDKDNQDMAFDETGALLMDEDTHFIDTYKAMEKLVEKGLTKAIGLSNFNSKQIRAVLDACKVKPVTNQVECHPYFNQRRLVEFCRAQDLVVTAYSPLGSPNTPFTDQTNSKILQNEAIAAIGRRHAKTSAQVALRWQIQRGNVAIPKAIESHQIEENFDIFDFELSGEEMDTINSLQQFDRFVNTAYVLPAYKNHRHYPFAEEF